MLRVSDLLDWIASPKEIHWDRGLKGICEADCQPLPASEQTIHQYDKGLNAKFSPGHSEFLADVRQEKEAIGMCSILFLTFPVGFCLPIIFSNLNYNCSDLSDLRNLQEQIKKAC